MVLAPVFCTPLMAMHMCLVGGRGEEKKVGKGGESELHARANTHTHTHGTVSTHSSSSSSSSNTHWQSTMTATPLAPQASSTAFATCSVSLSCIWRRLEKTSAMRASLLSPRTLPAGM